MSAAGEKEWAFLLLKTPLTPKLPHFRPRKRTHIFAPPTQTLAEGVLAPQAIILGPFVAGPPRKGASAFRVGKTHRFFCPPPHSPASMLAPQVNFFEPVSCLPPLRTCPRSRVSNTSGFFVTYPPPRNGATLSSAKERTHIFAPPTQPIAGGVLSRQATILGPFVACSPSERS